MCRYDSDAKIDSDGSENADEEQPKTQKRKKETPKSATPAKRKKKEVSNVSFCWKFQNEIP